HTARHSRHRSTRRTGGKPPHVWGTASATSGPSFPERATTLSERNHLRFKRHRSNSGAVRQKLCDFNGHGCELEKLTNNWLILIGWVLRQVGHNLVPIGAERIQRFKLQAFSPTALGCFDVSKVGAFHPAKRNPRSFLGDQFHAHAKMKVAWPYG